MPKGIFTEKQTGYGLDLLIKMKEELSNPIEKDDNILKFVSLSRRRIDGLSNEDHEKIEQFIEESLETCEIDLGSNISYNNGALKVEVYSVDEETLTALNKFKEQKFNSNTLNLSTAHQAFSFGRLFGKKE